MRLLTRKRLLLVVAGVVSVIVVIALLGLISGHVSARAVRGVIALMA